MRLLAVFVAFLHSCFGTLSTPTRLMSQHTWLIIMSASRITTFWIDPLAYYLPLGEHILFTVSLLVFSAVGNTSLCHTPLLNSNLKEFSLLARKFQSILGMEGLEGRYFQVRTKLKTKVNHLKSLIMCTKKKIKKHPF
jgi:hypothetical protein